MKNNNAKHQLNKLCLKHGKSIKDWKKLKGTKRNEDRKPKWIRKYADREGKPKLELKPTPFH